MTIEQQIARKLLNEYREGLTWSQVVASVQATTTQDRAEIVQALSGGQTKTVGRKMQALVGAHLRALALSDAAEMMADDSLSREELERIL